MKSGILNKRCSILILAFIESYWGFTTVFMKNILEYMTPSMYVFLRFLFASIALILLYWRKSMKFDRGTVLRGSVLGGLTVVPILMTVVALQDIAATNSVFYTQFVIIFVPLLLWVIKRKKPGMNYYLSLIVIMTGLWVFTECNLSMITLGDVVTIIASFLNGLAIIATTVYAAHTSHYELGIVQMVSGTLISIPMLFSESMHIQWNKEVFTILIITGVVGSGIAFTAKNFAQRNVSSTTASMLTVLSPIFGVLGARIISNSKGITESVTMSQYCGVFILCVGMVLYFTGVRNIKEIKNILLLPKYLYSSLQIRWRKQ
ncbi:DMT family transporter [[Clostridium] innocuum]|uniref:DMT family transporter n=1 Tax=Clostridium innocuum TaxID=1522 RepID=UPI003A4E5B9A